MSGIFDQIINYSPPLIVSGTVNYKGTWNASTNNPTLNSSPASSTKGDYYVVSTAGTQFGITFAIGDWIISNGTAWEKVDLTDAVSSVFGRTGAVVGVSTDYSAVGITNTAIGATNPSTGAFTTVTASSTISASNFSGSSSGVNTGDQTTITGNAGSATVLQTSRNIHGGSFNGSADVTNVIIGTYGGTGVNNGANTITIAGNVTHAGAFTQSFTATANTSLTLPTTGTLATLAGSEALSNKTITASSFSGSVAATTLSTSGDAGIGTASPTQRLQVSSSAGSTYALITNTSTGPSNLFLGAGNATTQLISRDATTGAVPISVIIGTTERANFSSTGLAVTGQIASISGGADRTKLYASGTKSTIQFGSAAEAVTAWQYDRSLGTLDLLSGTEAALTTVRASFETTGLTLKGNLTVGVSGTGTNIVIREYSAGTQRNWGIRDDAGVDRLRFSRGASDYWFWDSLKVAGSDNVDVQNWRAVSGFNWTVSSTIRTSINSTGLAVTGALTTTGDVGIGTTPGAKLDVKGLVRSSIGTGTGSGGAAYAFYQFGTSATATENWHIGTEGDGSFRFYNQGFGAGIERMRINGSGSVAIGTTPFSDTRFTVVPSGDYAPGITVRSSSSTANWARLDLYNANTAGPLIFGQDNTGFSFIRNDGTDSGISFQTSGGVERAKVSTTGLGVVGALSCTGALSKGSGSFRIEHPLPEKSATHQLVHSFIEGPQADLIYRGKVVLVDGKASVNIDAAATMTEGTFEVLCRDVQCFTTNETGWTAVRGKVTGNILTIEAKDADCADEISWMVIGERCDPHMMETDWTDDNGKVIVEPLKPVQPIQ